MAVWTTIFEHVWSSRAPFLIAAYLVVAAIVRRSPRLERANVKIAGPLVAGHLIATVIGAVQDWQGYDHAIANVTALAFGLLATLSIGMTLMFRILLPRVGLALPRILVDLVTMIGAVVVFIAVGNRAGFSVAGLITTSAVLTAVIGFSMQDTLGNIMGGLAVQLDKSLQVGDWVQLGGSLPSGRIAEIRWRYTAIETRNWDTVIVPNSMLVKSTVTILGRRMGAPVQTRRTVDFFVDFRTPPTEVIATVEASLRRDPVPRMATDPPPYVLFFGIRDSFAHYIVRYWLTDLASDDPPDSAVRERVWYALERSSIPLSIPASTVFLTQNTEERQSRKATTELARRTDALASVDLFRALSEDARRTLAGYLVHAPFGRGEAITREGERDDGLYMIVRGETAVRIGSGRDAREVARLGAGQFFGEMSLMTGETRAATVIATTDIECYRVDKPALEHVLRLHPEIAEQIAGVLAERRDSLTAIRERDEDARREQETAKQDLLGRIRGFFGMDA